MQYNKSPPDGGLCAFGNCAWLLRLNCFAVLYEDEHAEGDEKYCRKQADLDAGVERL